MAVRNCLFHRKRILPEKVKKIVWYDDKMNSEHKTKRKKSSFKSEESRIVLIARSRIFV